MKQLNSLVLRPAFQDPQGGGEAPLVQRPEEGAPSAPTGGTTQPGGPKGPGGPPPSPCGYEQLLMIGAIFLIFYFLILRPQQKQEKMRRAMLGALKVGDSVVTSGGMHGTVSSLSDDQVVVQVDPKLKLTFDRVNIARVLGGEGEAKSDKS